jgi:NAD+ synthase (glutamine-hydrolysing)
MSVRIAIAQINATVGDFSGNRARIVEFARRARQQNADLLLTPELALCGYPPEDLLLRDDFCSACESELQVLAGELPDIAVLVGHPEQRDGRRYNAATLLSGGRRVATYCKQRLPNYEVFDEERYFDSGDGSLRRDAQRAALRHQHLRRRLGSRRGRPGPRGRGRRSAGAQRLALPHRQAASAPEVLRERIAAPACRWSTPTSVGGQDELVFDGGSFASTRKATLRCQLPKFEEALGSSNSSMASRSRRRSRPNCQSKKRSTRRWCSACATISARTVSRRDHRPVRRHRLGAHAVRRRRCAGRRQGARGDDAFALYRRNQPQPIRAR